MKAARAPEELNAEHLATSTSPQDQRKEARDQLTLILSFFSRVDAKASALLAINTGMLAILASNAPPVATMSVLCCVFAGIAAGIIAASLWFIYGVAFPALDGGHDSLIYFREIAKLTECKFVDGFATQDEAPRVKDLLGQVWRNSCILAAKFDALKRAFILTALAIIPWAIAVAMFSSHIRVSGLITR